MGSEDFSEEVHSEAGEYTVKATIAETTKYKGSTATADFTIIPPILPDNNHQVSEVGGEVRNGLEIYTYGYCSGSSYSLHYYLSSDMPDQYKIDFEDSRLTNVEWTDIVSTGFEGTIDLEIPDDMPMGDYKMSVTFRYSHIDEYESEPFTVTFHVNLPETYTVPIFDNVMAVVDTCGCLTDIRWYHRDNSSVAWQAIEGAKSYYYRQVGGLTGEYFISTKMNGVETYTCPQTDVKTLYGAKSVSPKLSVSPNHVVNTAIVTIEDFDNSEHNFIGGLGLSLDMHVGGKYKGKEGKYSFSGTFPALGTYELSNMPEYGFTAYDDVFSAKIENKRAVGSSLIADAGVRTMLKEQYIWEHILAMDLPIFSTNLRNCQLLSSTSLTQ